MKGGSSNWCEDGEKFREHTQPCFYQEAVKEIASLSNKPINVLLSDLVTKEQNTARTVLELSRLPLRGCSHRDGVLWQLMPETHSLPAAREWLLRRDICMSDIIHKEIIEHLAHGVKCKIVSWASSNCKYYRLTADGTTDINWSEQFSCHLWYVDPNPTQQSAFWGFYNV